MQNETVIVLDFGGQYNQLIARRVRECNVYCEVMSYKNSIEKIKEKNPVGIIFTGGPNSVYDEKSPHYDKTIFELGIPILGICYGSQLMAYTLGGHVDTAPVSEYGKTEITTSESKLFENVDKYTVVWMSHTDYIDKIPEGFKITAYSNDCPCAAYEDEEKDVALELSNFQLLGIEHFAPHVSVVCNLAPDHLDYMPSVESYYESKMRIYENCTEDDWFLLNVYDATVMQYAQHIPCKVIDFSLTRQDVDLYRKDGTVYLHELALFEEKNFHVVGDYNLSNAMIASCMAYKLGVSVSDIQKAIAAFSPVEHRLEYIGEKNGVKFYNDSKATNTHAVAAALNSFNKNIILLAGGHDKGISFEDLKQYDERVKLCVAFGETGPQFQDIFSCVQVVETMQEALDAAVANSKEQDIVLLSPACSSYDQFPNYEVRGALFKEMVRKWLQA